MGRRVFLVGEHHGLSVSFALAFVALDAGFKLMEFAAFAADRCAFGAECKRTCASLERATKSVVLSREFISKLLEFSTLGGELVHVSFDS